MTLDSEFPHFVIYKRKSRMMSFRIVDLQHNFESFSNITGDFEMFWSFLVFFVTTEYESFRTL